MKSLARIVSRRTMVVLAVSLACLAIYAAATWGWAMTYADIQARGGILPLSAERAVLGAAWLDLRCNISGTEAITVRPTELSGFDGISSMRVRRDSSRIYVRVYVGAWPGGHANAQPVWLGWPDAGTYDVYYDDPEGDPVWVGSVEVPA